MYADPETLKILRDLGPWKVALRNFASPVKCEVCGESCVKTAMCKNEDCPDKMLRICLGECAKGILDDVTYRKLWDKLTKGGLLPEGKQEYTSAERKVIINEALGHISSGRGSKWRVIPSILAQSKARPLSVKQVQTLEKFNHSCEGVRSREDSDEPGEVEKLSLIHI